MWEEKLKSIKIKRSIKCVKQEMLKYGFQLIIDNKNTKIDHWEKLYKYHIKELKTNKITMCSDKLNEIIKCLKFTILEKKGEI